MSDDGGNKVKEWAAGSGSNNKRGWQEEMGNEGEQV